MEAGEEGKISEGSSSAQETMRRCYSVNGTLREVKATHHSRQVPTQVSKAHLVVHPYP